MATNRQKLVQQLNRYGYSLLEPEARADPNELLAEMVRTRDARILEGFPVVLANVLRSDAGHFNVKNIDRRLRSLADRKLFRALMEVSMELFRLFNVRVSAYSDLQEFSDKRHFSSAHDDDSLFHVAGLGFHPERLKKVFREYYEREFDESQTRERAVLRDEFRREFLLSHLFTPRQKQLVMKKLHREKMTKTEREYFSRTVKKKLLAMADPDLQRLAQKALQ